MFINIFVTFWVNMLVSQGFFFLQTSLLCILVELAGEGSVPVAVGIAVAVAMALTADFISFGATIRTT